ncbi:MAG: hypothetical protein ACOXZI_02275 [Candidatus Cryptobacteroides sp.]|jgi:predicted neutral ceramidase superfamily lipid hydrolase|nr:hypothetical protein [Rikenellaceae bacterium]
MRKHYRLIYFLLVIVQVMLGNLLNLGPYIIISLLPLLILSIPIKHNDAAIMLVAFATAFTVDFFTHGILGLSVVALLPVAFLRRWIVVLVFGNEVYSRGEEISVKKQGLVKMILSLLIATAIFFAIYVWVDAAGTRSFGFNLLRWFLSTLISAPVQLLLSGLLDMGD